MPTPKVRRFPWVTQAPSVRWFLTAKGPEVVLVMPTDGVSFQVLRNASGRLMPVSQLSSVEKLPADTPLRLIESVGSGVRSFGILTVVAEILVSSRSVMDTLFRQLKLAIRRGVSRLNDRTLVWGVCSTESTVPFSRGMTM